jgi:Cu/Zn superoxide dismutase
MYYDRDNPTTYPYGRFYLYQSSPSAPIYIRGYMRQMPPPASKHGFAINERAYTYQGKRPVCKTAGGHWNPFSETHGEMNNMTYPSHVGNLLQITDDGAGNSFYSASAERPTLYGP